MTPILLLAAVLSLNVNSDPVRVAVARLTHDHVHWIFSSAPRGDIQIVGIYEPNEELVRRYSRQYELSEDLFFDELDEMLDSVKPDAVSAFGSIREHVEVVRSAAPRGIHVMVEKPLAFDYDEALEIRELADEHGIHVLTNYETTWYASTRAVGELVKGGELGELRKIVVHDGHEGPKEIGVSSEFLEWLTDPAENGGGAIIDFGCYGANLITWLMDGAEPVSVTAVTQQIKPEIYPDVDDEATIILTYPDAQGIIQASWNWPFSRKDMEVYGRTGYVLAPIRDRIRVGVSDEEVITDLTPLDSPYDDPFSYLAGVVRGEITVGDTELSSLANNVTVVRILDAARRSAASGRTIQISVSSTQTK